MPVPLHPKNPERVCWGCDKYCPADDLACGNGTIRTAHPAELFGDDWLQWADGRVQQKSERRMTVVIPVSPHPCDHHSGPAMATMLACVGLAAWTFVPLVAARFAISRRDLQSNPMYAWYRVFAARRGQPPDRAANAIPSPHFASTIFLLWTVGVPLLPWGIAGEPRTVIASSAGLLLCAVVTGAICLVYMLRAPGIPLRARSQAQQVAELALASRRTIV